MLEVNHLSKSYNRSEVLNNISFKLLSGDIVGILGENGSGKSTLLKIISGIVAPTAGDVRYVGQLSSLLEIGSGIQPDLTGEENYYLKGELLGLSRPDLKNRIGELNQFTELAPWMNHPVKHYSDGMYMRLAFGIALTLEADIYLFDEILAVGDTKFQQKCFETIINLSQKGKIIVLVSHNITELERYCNRFIWLKKGEVREQSDSPQVLDRYLRDQLMGSDPNKILPWQHASLAFSQLSITNEQGEQRLTNTNEIWFAAEFQILKPLSVFNVTMHIQDHSGLPIFSISTSTSAGWIHEKKPQNVKLSTFVESGFLNAGTYTVSFYIQIESRVFQLRNLFFLGVSQSESDTQSHLFSGKIRTNFQWKQL
ncbi:ABC transporter ATP-binding protein [Marinoscillum luteum]|jgi:lipopolysaccharide transport system ATP-binding protein|uniref:Polysaccharide ABC transporter ATP-binding protein n=1 Tax=Marinoscillum luteum TaxID=861051 RepID=A0ABW7NEC9_9BACT